MNRYQIIMQWYTNLYCYKIRIQEGRSYAKDLENPGSRALFGMLWSVPSTVGANYSVALPKRSLFYDNIMLRVFTK